jgi:hypothetical protein
VRVRYGAGIGTDGPCVLDMERGAGGPRLHVGSGAEACSPCVQACGAGRARQPGNAGAGNEGGHGKRRCTRHGCKRGYSDVRALASPCKKMIFIQMTLA